MTKADSRRASSTRTLAGSITLGERPSLRGELTEWLLAPAPSAPALAPLAFGLAITPGARSSERHGATERSRSGPASGPAPPRETPSAVRPRGGCRQDEGLRPASGSMTVRPAGPSEPVGHALSSGVSRLETLGALRLPPPSQQDPCSAPPPASPWPCTGSEGFRFKLRVRRGGTIAPVESGGVGRAGPASLMWRLRILASWARVLSLARRSSPG